MWRPATPSDDDRIVDLSLALYTEDPSPQPVSAVQTRRTLQVLRAEPFRGRAVVLELDGRVEGYALLISFWSNEFGGEVCDIDEIYVESAHRSQGHARRLFDELARGGLWPGRPVALGLEVTPANTRARALYERLGFTGSNIGLRRRLLG